jgi:hypothetical protein
MIGKPSEPQATTGGTRWKGRQQNTSPRYQEFAAHWLHRDYVRQDPALGNVPTSVNEVPSQVATAYDEVNDGPAAPAVLLNKEMRSIGELGHIFDPAQAADNLSAPTSSELPYNNKISGGGRTLRIGQPEFSSATSGNWDRNDRRASRTRRATSLSGTSTGSQRPALASPACGSRSSLTSTKRCSWRSSSRPRRRALSPEPARRDRSRSAIRARHRRAACEGGPL